MTESCSKGCGTRRRTRRRNGFRIRAASCATSRSAARSPPSRPPYRRTTTQSSCSTSSSVWKTSQSPSRPTVHLPPSPFLASSQVRWLIFVRILLTHCEAMLYLVKAALLRFEMLSNRRAVEELNARLLTGSFPRPPAERVRGSLAADRSRLRLWPHSRRASRRRSTAYSPLMSRTCPDSRQKTLSLTYTFSPARSSFSLRFPASGAFRDEGYRTSRRRQWRGMASRASFRCCPSCPSGCCTGSRRTGT